MRESRRATCAADREVERIVGHAVERRVPAQELARRCRSATGASDSAVDPPVIAPRGGRAASPDAARQCAAPWRRECPCSAARTARPTCPRRAGRDRQRAQDHREEAERDRDEARDCAARTAASRARRADVSSPLNRSRLPFAAATSFSSAAIAALRSSPSPPRRAAAARSALKLRRAAGAPSTIFCAAAFTAFGYVMFGETSTSADRGQRADDHAEHDAAGVAALPVQRQQHAREVGRRRDRERQGHEMRDVLSLGERCRWRSPARRPRPSRCAPPCTCSCGVTCSPRMTPT